MITVTWKWSYCGVSSLLCLFSTLIWLPTFRWINNLWSSFKTQLPRRVFGMPSLGWSCQTSVGFPLCCKCCCFSYKSASFLVYSTRNVCHRQFMPTLISSEEQRSMSRTHAPRTPMPPHSNKHFHLPLQHPNQGTADNGPCAQPSFPLFLYGPAAYNGVLHFK